MALKFIQKERLWWQGHGQPDASVSGLVRGFSEEREIPVTLSEQFISNGAGSEVVKKGEDIPCSYQPFIREVSAKASSVGDGVLEAILSCKYVRLSFD